MKKSTFDRLKNDEVFVSLSLDEPLAPEVGGRIYIGDYNGNEVAIEMATAPTAEEELP